MMYVGGRVRRGLNRCLHKKLEMGSQETRSIIAASSRRKPIERIDGKRRWFCAGGTSDSRFSNSWGEEEALDRTPKPISAERSAIRVRTGLRVRKNDKTPRPEKKMGRRREEEVQNKKKRKVRETEERLNVGGGEGQIKGRVTGPELEVTDTRLEFQPFPGVDSIDEVTNRNPNLPPAQSGPSHVVLGDPSSVNPSIVALLQEVHRYTGHNNLQQFVLLDSICFSFSIH
jgi:hypothetical protein